MVYNVYRSESPGLTPGSGNLVAGYTYGGGLLSRTDAGGTDAYYLYDALGNTDALVGPGGEEKFPIGREQR